MYFYYQKNQDIVFYSEKTVECELECYEKKLTASEKEKIKQGLKPVLINGSLDFVKQPFDIEQDSKNQKLADLELIRKAKDINDLKPILEKLLK